MINRRLELMIEDPVYGIRIFVKKIASGWNNPTFQSLDILRGEGRFDFWQNIAATKQGIVLHFYMNAIQTIILFGCFYRWVYFPFVLGNDVYLCNMVLFPFDTLCTEWI